MIDICTLFKQLRLGTQHLLFPPMCMICNDRGSAGLDLCLGCHHDLPWNRHACPSCALPLPPPAVEVVNCAKCQQVSPPYERAWSAFRYLGALRWLHRRVKFNADFSHNRLLGQLLANTLEEELIAGQLVRPDIIMVMPLHPHRLRRRGFNQSLELIRPAAQRLQIELDYRSLRRLKPTRPQSGLPARLRRQNVRKAFGCQQDLSGLNIALFDDVVTTGETVAEATRVLLQAGAKEVSVWSLARTPET